MGRRLSTDSPAEKHHRDARTCPSKCWKFLQRQWQREKETVWLSRASRRSPVESVNQESHFWMCTKRFFLSNASFHKMHKAWVSMCVCWVCVCGTCQGACNLSLCSAQISTLWAGLWFCLQTGETVAAPRHRGCSTSVEQHPNIQRAKCELQAQLSTPASH